MHLRLAFPAALLSCLLSVAASAAEVGDLAFRFSPVSGETLSWRAEETETAWLAGRQDQRVVWSQKLTITFGREIGDVFEAKLTVSSVSATTGTPDTLHYILARAAADKPMDVFVDRSGYVRQVMNWPGVRSEMAAALPSLTDAASAKLVATVLDKLDAAQAGAAVARPLLLASAGYGLPFRNDGSVAELGDWQGGSAYIFPGRKVATRLLGKQGAVVFATWRLTTDRKLAAERIGGEVLALLNIAADGESAFAGAARKASALLATGGLDLAEDGGIAFDAAARMVTRFEHRLLITVGDFRKEQTLLLSIVP